ncbi:MAG: glycoside hydrolase family 44 protein [Capsulimonadales bacterium]|nr:glycoside hydrolase family 44 protein [Capsulimonadales bacterium]
MTLWKLVEKPTGTMTALALVSLLAPFAAAQTGTTYIQVDASVDRRPIDPRIYGTAYASAAALSDLNFILTHEGGNATSLYNWKLNASNRGNDWFFESIGESSNSPAGKLEALITRTKSAGVGAQAMINIPMVGWVAKLGPNRSKLASFSIAKYGMQTDADWQWFPDAGDGFRASTGKPIEGNDPNDANMPVNSVFQQDMVRHLVSKFGLARNGGVQYYLYDNEPSLWHSTHRDVYPTGLTLDTLRDRIIEYGTKIRDVDPGAILVGPEEWGWLGYLLSGYDQWYANRNGWGYYPDKASHGNMDSLPWLLDQLRQHQTRTGKRLLDFLSVHSYPQGGEFSNDTSVNLQLLRNRSTRSLWDPNYTDASWINDRVRLIPRLKEWIDRYYPGTRIAITEYNWGAEAHINGATAQADILGILGREGVHLATRYATPESGTPTYKAMKLYRNYDGNRSTFGDTSVRASVANPDTLSAFAAVRSTDGALTVMAVNKNLTGTTSVNINLANFTAMGSVQTYQLTAANTITRLPDRSLSGSVLSATLPAQSVTLFVLPTRAGFATTNNGTVATVARNSSARVGITVRNTGGPVSGAIIDLEIYNAAGQRVYQQFVSGQNFASSESRAYSWNWTPTAAGVYSIKIGLFSGNWSTLYHWNNGVTTVTVY